MCTITSKHTHTTVGITTTLNHITVILYDFWNSKCHTDAVWMVNLPHRHNPAGFVSKGTIYYTKQELNLFIYFNPASHTCDFRYVKNITYSNIQCSVIKNIYTIQCYSKTILEKLCTLQNNFYINIDNYQYCIYTSLACKNSSSV
jgi:hypothetical protein